MSLGDACGCEPVRKNSLSSIKLNANEDNTDWIPPVRVADFLLKLYGGVPYDANDRVIHLEPATISHEGPVAEDLGIIDPTIFNYSDDQVPDLHGIREGEWLIDEVIVFLVKELLEAYPVQEYEFGMHRSAVLAHPKVYFAPPALSYQYTSKEWVLDPEAASDREGIKNLKGVFRAYTYFVYLVHTGEDRAGHYYCVVYNKATSTLFALDSATQSSGFSNLTQVFANCFISTLRSINLHPKEKIKLVNAPSEQQTDGNSCGLYAIHNTHRILHALCRGGLEDQPALFDDFITNPQKFTDLPKLTPELITEWRLKIKRVYYEKCRRIRKVLTFSDLRYIQILPGYHDTSHTWHHSKNKEARLYMPPEERKFITYTPSTNLPYDQRFISPETLVDFKSDSGFAQLERDWRRRDVAGVIIRLSQSPARAKQQMYRAVGWNQTVLLSCLPHGRKGYNLNRPDGRATTKAQVIDSCRQEIAKLTQSRPDLTEDELNIHSRYLIGMHCVDTPKLVIQTKHDGTTWAKVNWTCNREMRGASQISINGIAFRTVSGCMVRLPDYAYIVVGGTDTLYRAHYIWAQKWPHAGRFKEKVVQIPYVNPGIWNWWNLDNLLHEYQVEYKDSGLDHLGGPHLNKWDSEPVSPYQPPAVRKNTYLRVSNHSGNTIIKAIRDISGIDIITSPKRTLTTEKEREKITTPSPKRRRVKDADTYLELDPIGVNDPNDPYAKRPVISKLKAYLATLLVGTYGPTFVNEKHELVRPGILCGHLHHHHRPYRTIIDHKWRVQYYTKLQPGRFPWPDGTTDDIKTMISACQAIHELKQKTDPIDAGRWRRMANLLEFGEKTYQLWYSKPLQNRQTMRCMSHKCEKLRQLCVRFENSRIKDEESYWDMFEQYQQWKYGAQDCPKNCPLRAFDCPADCGVIHDNPLDINEADYIALISTLTETPLVPSQSKYVETFLNEMFPLRWPNTPPPYWMPMKALNGFWDPKNRSVTALKARADACTKRLIEWQMLPRSDQDAILKGMDEVYYKGVEKYFQDADWKRKSREAQTRAQIYEMQMNKSNTHPRPYIQAVYNYMQIKMKDAARDTPRLAIDWGVPRKIEPNEITFASLSKFW